MEIFIKAVQFILSLSLLVVIHELGHFLFARMFGVRVEKFYLFFDPWFSLFKFNYKGTEYGIGWVPFGGYVKIAGMIDESMDTEAMKEPAKPDEFRSKPAWQRLLVMTGGVLMNVLLALCIYIGMSYKWGEQYLANDDVKYGYAFSDLGREMGFRDGDMVISVNGTKPGNWTSIFIDIALEGGSRVEVLRDGKEETVIISEDYTSRLLNQSTPFMQPRFPFIIKEPVSDGNAARAGLIAGDRPLAVNGTPLEHYNEFREVFGILAGTTVDLSFARDNDKGGTDIYTVPVEISKEGLIGVYNISPDELLTITEIDYSFAQAIPAGFRRTGAELGSYWKQVKLLFKPKSEAYKSLGGFFSIGNIFPEYWSWMAFWRITAFLSIVLAIMNMLPIPALDGGHVLFLLYEVISRRKPSDKFMEYAQMTGLVLLFALLIYANGNDIYRLFIK